MAKVKFTNIDKVSKDLGKKLKSFYRDKNEMNKAANIMKVELLTNLRDGKGGNDKPLPPLKASTINRRGELAQYNRTHSKYSQFKSNMTFSGQFLRSLQVKPKLTFRNGKNFEFTYDGIHKGYKDSDGDRYVSVNNSDIFRGLNNEQRQLTGVTDRARVRIRQQFIRYLRRKK